MKVEQSSSRILEHFRAAKRRLPLHPLEKAVLWAVAVHLCFLPWALGTMHAWSQITSLVLASIGMLLALIPRTYSGDLAPQLSAFSSQPSAQNPQVSGFRSQVSAMRLTMWPRLLHFPIFWIGFALLAYIALQASNPSWVWERSETQWWLRRVDDNPWLPTSIDTPFERFNIWRQFIIYASAWLTVCTIWTGFTRRRSLEILLLTIAANGVALAATGIAVQLIRSRRYMLWFPEPFPDAIPFASFVYKNHAGAWLSLVALAFVSLAALMYKRSVREMARSSPTVLFVLGALGILLAVAFTYSRGATVLLVAFFLLAGMIFLFRRFNNRTSTATHPMVPISVTLLVVLLVGYNAMHLDFSQVEGAFARLVPGKIKDLSVSQREEAHLASLAMLGDCWQRGVGAGGFRYLYPEYIKRHPAIYDGGQLFWEHAHNDWFEFTIELGAAGMALILTGAGYVGWKLFQFKFWRDLVSLLLVLGLGQTLLHAIFDFPFQNPAILTMWSTLLVFSLRWVELDPGN